MADDLARRREIRRRKILESSEARLKKITSNNSKNLPDDPFCEKEPDEIDPVEEEYDGPHNSALCGTRGRRDPSPSRDGAGDRSEYDSLPPHPANGDFPRSSSPDAYTFPKKVSDAETRSFGRTRCDARRSSTQIVMETLHFSSCSLAVLRSWLVAMAAMVVKVYFLRMEVLPIFQTIFFPFLMLEVAIFSWSRFDAQVCSRAPLMMSSILLLCGLSSTLISGFNSVSNFIHCSLQDFCIYIFSFVFLHFIFEMSV